MSLHTVYRKTVTDLSNPKLLVAYFVPFLAIAGFLALGLTSNDFAGADATLAEQEAALSAAFAVMGYTLALGFPFLGLAAVLPANTLAKESERGTLRILLSKPTPRWRILFGTFAALVTFLGFVGLASLLLSAVMLVEWGGVHAAAISAGVFDGLAGYLAFALFGASVVTAIGLALAVYTGSRLRTALGALAIPALHFGFLPIRVFSGDMYEDYSLYLLDVNHHFGNAFVFVHDVVGTELGIEAQLNIAAWTGVYEVPESQPDSLPESLEMADLVAMELSVLLLAGLAIAALALAVYRFQRMDV